MCLASMMVSEWKLVETFSLMTLTAVPKGNSAYVANLTIQPDLMEQIRQALPKDRRTRLWVNEQSQVKISEFELRDGILRF